MRTSNLLTSVIASCILISCGSEEKPKVQNQVEEVDKSTMLAAQELFQPLPVEAISDSNVITSEKVLLGKTLFYDHRLSKDNARSCNTCHNLATYGVDNKSISIGDLGKNVNRNTPTVYNAAVHIAQFWDGRAKNIEEESGMHILNSLEMNMPSEEYVIARLKKIKGYKKLFSDAFPTDKDPISFSNLKKAIGAFERTLMTPGNFDRFISGDVNALSEEEQAGLQAFIDIGCTTCHTGKAIGGGMVQKFPLHGTEYMSLTGSTHEDLGKMEFTKDTFDKFLFKVPSLINVTETSPYLHDGSVKDLDKMIRIMAKLELNKEINDEQIASIKKFLGSLKRNLPENAVKAPVLP